MKQAILPFKIAFLCVTFILLTTLSALATISLQELKVNYQEKPLGIDAEKVYFSWQMHSTKMERGLQQTAYQIVVIDESDNQVWDSGKISTDIALGVPYQGQALKATTRYDWTLTVWHNEGSSVEENSWFEMGLMNADPNLSAWEGANWIGGGEKDMVLQSHYLSVFKAQYQIQLDQTSKTTKAAFILGANDQRLMDKNLNLNGMEVQKDESYLAFELDISGLQNGGTAHLNIYRVGYAPKDTPEQALKTYAIPTTLINTDNQYEPHQFYLESVYGVMEIFVNGKENQHQLTGATDPRQSGVNLNPYGRGGDFIVFPLLADIGFQIAKGQKARFSEVQIRHYRQPSNVIFSEQLSTEQAYQGIFDRKGLSIVDNTYQIDGGQTGLLLIANPSQNAAPILRTTFSPLNKSIKKARIYATARGIYELHLNGQRIGKDYFNPGLTQYNKTHLYQTYEVTDLVQAGKANAIGAWLSEGWWSGSITFSGANWNYFGDRQSLLCKLVITYTDDTKTVVTSNPTDWKIFTDGPVRYGSFFQGEFYDATKEAAIKDWSTAEYEAVNWKPVVAVPLEGTSVTDTLRNFMGRPIPMSYEEQKIVGQIGENVSIVNTLTAQSVKEVRSGVFVYDMGQNMVGVPNIAIKNGQKGKSIRLRYAEVRYPNLAEYADNTDMIMLENIRGALTQDLYLLKGGDEIIQPRFTFHGYRFIEITGIDQALPLSAVKGKVLSSVKTLASHYETSNDLINRLWENITWSLRGNFLSIPTDTPARNERMGWNGDINVFSRASTWLADANAFLSRHLLAMRDMQAANGRFSDVAPVGNGFGGTLWGSAGIIVAWETYQQYGDINLLEVHYEAMKDYIEFLETKQNEDGILQEGPLGDWLSPENGKNDNTLLWTAYQVYNLDILQKVATILGKEKDAQDFEKQYETRKTFFNKMYVNDSNQKTVHSGAIAPSLFGPPPANPPQKGDLIDTQASYAIPLALNVFNEKNKVAAIEHLAQAITRKNTDDSGIERPKYSLMTGFIGTASIGEALSENGKEELAYQLVQNETYPSWLYPVKNGATTIWERLNSYTLEDGFGGNNSMNSFNHYSFGAIAAWMYNYSLGIQREPNRPGFKHFILKPIPDPTGKMTFAKGYYDSMYGRIISEWSLEEKGTNYKITVPPNTTATLYLKASTFDKITENGRFLIDEKGIKKIGMENKQLIFELEAGAYDFFVEK